MRRRRQLWKRLIAGELATPDTWEVALSAGEGTKRANWERLLAERKLGALALLRNLRNMKDAGVDEQLVLAALDAMKTERVLPFRFLAAARYAPQWEEALERAMFRAVADAASGCRAARCCWSTCPGRWLRRCRGSPRCCGRMRRMDWRCCCARSRRR